MRPTFVNIEDLRRHVRLMSRLTQLPESNDFHHQGLIYLLKVLAHNNIVKRGIFHNEPETVILKSIVILSPFFSPFSGNQALSWNLNIIQL